MRLPRRRVSGIGNGAGIGPGSRRRSRELADAGAGLCEHPVQPARPDHRRERPGPRAGLDLLARCSAGAGGGADRRRRHHVRRRPLSQRSLLSRRGGRNAELDVLAADRPRRDRRCLLRHRQPWRGLCRRRRLLQHPRQPHRRSRRRDRRADLARQARRDHDGPDHDDGAHRREGPRYRRQFRRRDGGSRLDHGARQEHRRDRLARLFDRPRRRGADRGRFRGALRLDEGQGPGRRDLASRALADRRRHGLGLGQLRPGAQPDLSRDLEPGPLEPHAAARRQPLDRDDLRPRRRYGAGEVGLPDGAARHVGPRQRQRVNPDRARDRRRDARRDPAAGPDRVLLRARPRYRAGDLGRELRAG